MEVEEVENKVNLDNSELTDARLLARSDSAIAVLGVLCTRFDQYSATLHDL